MPGVVPPHPARHPAAGQGSLEYVGVLAVVAAVLVAVGPVAGSSGLGATSLLWAEVGFPEDLSVERVAGVPSPLQEEAAGAAVVLLAGHLPGWMADRSRLIRRTHSDRP